MNCSLLLYRTYGQPKISKPKLLKGGKPWWKTRCLNAPVDVYSLSDERYVIYFGALFCKEMGFPEPVDMTLPCSALKKKYPDRMKFRAFKNKFPYPDAWDLIFERNEGYVLVEGLKERLEPPKRLLAYRGDSWPPLVAQNLVDMFVLLDLQDKGFACASYGDRLYIEYDRFFNDFVWKVYNENWRNNGYESWKMRNLQ